MRACDYSVYQIKYITSMVERVDTCGGHDSEPTGRRIEVEGCYLCVAPDSNLAMAAFRRYHGNDLFLEATHVGKLDDLVYLQ